MRIPNVSIVIGPLLPIRTRPTAAENELNEA